MKLRVKDALAILMNVLFVLFSLAMIARFGTMAFWFWFVLDFGALVACLELAGT